MVYPYSHELNHVLAQIYTNFYDNGKPKKAKISRHSDKTKDMPENGLIAFCTFYESMKNAKNIGFDYFYRKCPKESNSVLTTLCFELKKQVLDTSFTREFSVKLYPDSVFIIPLSTNRFYTHSICPSTLPIEELPTRMGYVVRCSNRPAVYKDGQVYIKEDSNLVEMHSMTSEEMTNLKDSYFQENTSIKIISYDKFYSSMNKGDYKCPKL